MFLSAYHASRNQLAQLQAYPSIGWSAASDQELYSDSTVNKVS